MGRGFASSTSEQWRIFAGSGFLRSLGFFSGIDGVVVETLGNEGEIGEAEVDGEGNGSGSEVGEDGACRN